MGLENDLRNEIEKWARKIDEETRDIRPLKEGGEEYIRNIEAYIKDSGHFMEKGDLVRSFEAIIWAWAWIEILKEIGIIQGQ